VPSRPSLPYIVRPIADRPAPIHLNPNADLAERVLLPGDPQRALAIAQSLLEAPRMFNTRRGLWGYTGRAADGELVTVQSTGMGGPSAAIVIEELAALGARTFVRVGTCGALRHGLALGELVVATDALAFDGASRALGSGSRALPDERLTHALLATGARGVTVASTDLFYDAGPDRDGLASSGAEVVEMESAALFTLAARRSLSAASLLAVTDLLAGGRRRIADDELEELGRRLGEVALSALA
jgi:uridine phosphorylase